jgi:hypothetical protein
MILAMSIPQDSTSKQTARLDDWRRTIGTFILNFGHLEYLVTVFLKDNLEHAEYTRFAERLLKDRVARIAKYINEGDYSQAKREEFALLVKRLDPVRTLRNHIAHGYMCWNMADPGGTPWVSIVLPKNVDQEHLSETRHLKFDDLRASVADLDKVIAAVDRLVGFNPRTNSHTSREQNIEKH